MAIFEHTNGVDNVQLPPTTMNLQYPQDAGFRNGYAYSPNNLNGTDAASYQAAANYSFIPEHRPYLQPYHQPQSNNYLQPQHHIKAQYQPQHQLPSINVLQAQATPSSQAQQDMTYSQSSMPAANVNFSYFGQQEYTTGQPYIPLPNYATGSSSNGKYSTAQQQQQQRFPLSPVSLPDKSISLSSVAPSTVSSASSSHYNYPLSSTYQPQQQQQQQSHTLSAPISESNIDYSSLVSYTISPSLKRKRRRRNDKSKLSSTIQNPTAEEESYPCPSCDKVFLKPYNLKSHLRSHSDEKPYACAHCSKRFCRSHDRKRHELLHKGAKNFSCEGYLKDGVTKWGCGKKFARSDALARHFRTETGWMCIRPLMDEAKRLEESGGVTIGVDGLPVGAPASVISAISGANGIGGTLNPDYKSYTEEDYDNSNMIKRMIHNR
ncbi:hypothetical protein CANMA_001268 [Candida margitis]|uniref:uncharacterized protein n=1 Tax=Candida margitis TaxID=1775924 RepID=UPI0022266CF3|nr:uncharacterized protein CANMA_001268 [Candida margitis]KAI5969605.1 hypothetical protein CANMA_001268 [Candida margitis]